MHVSRRTSNLACIQKKLERIGCIQNLARIQKNLALGMYPEELRTYSMYPEELSMYSEELRTCSSSGCGYMQCMYASEYMHACMYPEELRTYSMYPEELSMYSEELRTCSSSGCGYMQCMYASEYMHACMYPEELRTWHVSRRS